MAPLCPRLGFELLSKVDQCHVSQMNMSDVFHGQGNAKWIENYRYIMNRSADFALKSAQGASKTSSSIGNVMQPLAWLYVCSVSNVEDATDGPASRSREESGWLCLWCLSLPRCKGFAVSIYIFTAHRGLWIEGSAAAFLLLPVLRPTFNTGCCP